MTRSTSVRALPAPKLIDLLRRELLEIFARLRLAPRQPDGGEKQRRAARGADAPGKLAAPARVEQVVVALRHLVGRHQAGVVGDAEIADPGAGPVSARIPVAFRHRLDHGRVIRLREFRLDGELADAGAFDQIGDKVVRAHLGRDLGDDLLGVAAPERHLHERIFLHEGLRQRTLRLIDDGRGIQDDPAFLAGAVNDHLLAVGGAAGEDVLRAGARHARGRRRKRRTPPSCRPRPQYRTDIPPRPLIGRRATSPSHATARPAPAARRRPGRAAR